MAPLALRDWLVSALKNEPDVKVQVAQNSADWLKIVEENLKTHTSERIISANAENQEFAQNFARLVGNEVQQKLMTQVDPIRKKLAQALMKMDETQSRVSSLEAKISNVTAPQDSEIKKLKTDVKVLSTVFSGFNQSLANLGQTGPAVATLKSEVETLIHKAKAEVTQNIASGDHATRTHNLQIWEQLTKQQEEKTEQRLKVL